MPRRLLVFLLVGCLAPASAAAAHDPHGIAPPGNSAIDEYVETVPGETGDHPRGGSGDHRGGAGDHGGGGLSDRERGRLERSGADGRTLIRLTEAVPVVGRPGRPGGAGHASGGSSSSGGSHHAATPGSRAPVHAALAAAVVPATGGSAFLMPGLLGVAALGAIAFWVLRRRAQRG